MRNGIRAPAAHEPRGQHGPRRRRLQGSSARRRASGAGHHDDGRRRSHPTSQGQSRCGQDEQTRQKGWGRARAAACFRRTVALARAAWAQYTCLCTRRGRVRVKKAENKTVARMNVYSGSGWGHAPPRRISRNSLRRMIYRRGSSAIHTMARRRTLAFRARRLVSAMS